MENGERSVIVFTPTGRDATLIQETLKKAGIESTACSSVGDLLTELAEARAALLLAEEALTADCVEAIRGLINQQPTWSDLPVIVLTSTGQQSPATEYRMTLLAPLGNISLIERPVRPSTLISIVRSALRARDRQYQFREQAKALQSSNEDLERFANIASHDLQEPLRTIASYSQLLARRNQHNLDEDSQVFLHHILNGVDRMRTLISELLDFSRHTSARDVPMEQVDCNNVFGLVLQNLQFKIAETGAKISFERLPVVLGGESQLTQVFQNLIGNALNYCQRTPEISVYARRSGDRWTIAIKDNGIGIPAEYQSRIFGLFERLHTRDEYPGSGIGLAACKRIIEQYGGRIWVESNPGEGSTFFFTLPAAKAEAAAAVQDYAS